MLKRLNKYLKSYIKFLPGSCNPNSLRYELPYDASDVAGLQYQSITNTNPAEAVVESVVGLNALDALVAGRFRGPAIWSPTTQNGVTSSVIVLEVNTGQFRSIKKLSLDQN